MSDVPTAADEETRLRAVQARVRLLARNHKWIEDAIRTAFDAYLALGVRYRHELESIRDRERGLARDLLVSGRLLDPKIQDNGPCLLVSVRGLCPSPLAERLQKFRLGDSMPKELEQMGAEAALAAFDWDANFRSPETSEEKRTLMRAEYIAAQAARTHVKFPWWIMIARPDVWPIPPNPYSLTRSDLKRLSIEDYRTVALHRLGGLADVGVIRDELVPEPAPTGDDSIDTPRFAAWQARFPFDHERLNQNQQTLSVKAFPPDIAEQMIADVEQWVNTREPETPAEDAVRENLASAEHCALNARSNPKHRPPYQVGSRDTDWNAIQGRLLAKHERGEPYTSLRKLSAELKCSDATIRKAINESETLKGWKTRSTEPKAAPKATDFGAVVRDNARQTTEPAPDDVLLDADVDATMARLIDQAKPDERARLNAMNDDERRELVATYQSQNLDDEPSPLKPDKPGERARKVKQHKRA